VKKKFRKNPSARQTDFLLFSEDCGACISPTKYYNGFIWKREVRRKIMEQREIRLAVSAALQDAGEATRSMEIVKGLRETAPEGVSLKAVFFSHGGRFEKKAEESGFEIYRSSPRLEGVGFRRDLKPSGVDFVGDAVLACELLRGEIEALKACRPDCILYGFWPFAGLARRMTGTPVPGICFLPLPLERSVYCSGLMTDVPDQLRLLPYLPAGARRALMKALPAQAKQRAPILRQRNILNAARECGWAGGELRDLFDLMKPDLTVVNDLPEFYRGLKIPSDYRITGPLYSQPEPGEWVGAEIERIFREDSGKTKIFCTMGSSGSSESLLEAVKAVASLPEDRFCAVVLVPKAVCSMEDAERFTAGHANLYLTDRFVPAKLVAGMADLVVSHGGQGTVQTAMASGAPIVGVAMQPEQQINLDHVVQSGAAVRIPAPRWNARKIRSAVLRVAGDPGFRRNAQKLRNYMEQSDGRAACSAEIWSFLTRTSAPESFAES
jgi:UDP:flavonoid glycosyltransferase YjiC (YdhE family)